MVAKDGISFNNNSEVIMIVATYDEIRDKAKQYHEGQVRDFTGEPYVNHPLRVAGILYELGYSTNLVMAAMLHDVLEDTDCTEEEMRAFAGDKITDIVLMVTEPAKLRCEASEVSKGQRKAEFLRHLEGASKAAQCLKAADIIDNAKDMAKNCHINTGRAERFLFAKRSMLLRLRKCDVVLKLKAQEALDNLEKSIDNVCHN